MRRVVLSLAVLLVVGTATGAPIYDSEQLLVPVLAFNIGGEGDNLWSSELYLTNTGEEAVKVEIGALLRGHTVPEEVQCYPFVIPFKMIPPRSTVVWTAPELGGDLGCLDAALGALLMSAYGPVHLESRMVNHIQLEGLDLDERLVGLGQEVSGVAVADLAAGDFLLPGLMWHRNACYGVAFDSYVGFANPGQEAISVVLDLAPEMDGIGLFVDGRPVERPYVIEIKPLSWSQIHLEPADAEIQVCMSPEHFDLFVSLSGPLAIYGSVVDRQSQDPRTVKPVIIP